METKNNNAFLSVLLIIFILSTFTLGGYIFYDKVIMPNQNDNTKEQNSNTINQNNQNNNFVSKINPSKTWIHEAEYERNVLANSYEVAYETFYAKDIIVPFININSSDATKANEEIKGVFDEAINRYNEGVKTNIYFVEIDYEKFIDNNIASVNFWYGKGGTDVIRPDYYTYTFDLTTGKKMSFEELYQKFNFTKNQIDTIIKQKITDEVNDIFEESFKDKNTTTYINESIDNYEKNLEDNTLRYFVNDDGELSVIARLSIPAGAGYRDTILEIE